MNTVVRERKSQWMDVRWLNWARIANPKNNTKSNQLHHQQQYEQKKNQQREDNPKILLTSYVSTRARKLLGNAKAYEMKAANSLWLVSPKIPANRFDHWKQYKSSSQ